MKKVRKLISISSFIGVVFTLGFITFLLSCNSSESEVKSDLIEETVTPQKETLWHIKAIHPDGHFLDVKAIDKDGNIYDVKAIQDSEQRQLLDIKALIGENKIPVKILLSQNEFSPVKAINKEGVVYDIKAISNDGEKLDVKGVSRSGNIINLKAIDKTGEFYGLKALSPKGQMNDVKGIKMSTEDLELIVSGVEVYAHIKAIPQAGCVSEFSIWNIKAIHPGGRILDVKALDMEGNIYDVKAIQDSDQRQLMDIKAFVDGKKIPIKILLTDKEYGVVKAITEDGNLFDIKAITPEGDQLDVEGVGDSGNIIHIKAIDKMGNFYGVKAISSEGLLNDVKGIKMSKENLELVMNGVEVNAHIKALPQTN